MKWITRERPKIDRLACPWLIKRFIDKEAEIIYVPFEEVKTKAKKLKAIPFDIPDVEYTHYKDECSFDYFLKKHKLDDPALKTLATIVRGADTDRHDLATQASGLWAISAGLAFNFTNDLELLEKGMVVYDALYSWAKHLQKERHTKNATEHLLIEIFEKYIKEQKRSRKTPAWAKEIRDLIQDQIDTGLTLKELSKYLNIHPAYLSREFSKHFDNLSFGDYIRKQRIEKGIDYLNNSTYSLTKIAYLTGFSDQSHFTRIFKKHTGKSPSEYIKDLKKVKTIPKR
jgi:AraC-like DNA-binding protein